MDKSVLFWKFVRNASLLLALVFCVFTPKNVLATGEKHVSLYRNYPYFFNQPANQQYLLYSQYLNALKPYKKSFDESLKPRVTLNTLALTLLKPNLTFNDLESLSKKSFYGNPDCFAQGGTPGPTGRVFSAPLCWDTPKQGCRSCACRCGYTGFIWDPTNSICGCGQ